MKTPFEINEEVLVQAGLSVEELANAFSENHQDPRAELKAIESAIDNLEYIMAFQEVLQVKRKHLVRELTQKVLEGKNIGEEEHDTIMSIEEVAKKLGCHRQTVYNKHIRKNGLRIINPTGSKRMKVLESDFLKYVEMVKRNAFK